MIPSSRFILYGMINLIELVNDPVELLSSPSKRKLQPHYIKRSSFDGVSTARLHMPPDFREISAKVEQTQDQWAAKICLRSAELRPVQNGIYLSEGIQKIACVSEEIGCLSLRGYFRKSICHALIVVASLFQVIQLRMQCPFKNTQFWPQTQFHQVIVPGSTLLFGLSHFGHRKKCCENRQYSANQRLKISKKIKIRRDFTSDSSSNKRRDEQGNDRGDNGYVKRVSLISIVAFPFHHSNLISPWSGSLW